MDRVLSIEAVEGRKCWSEL